MRITSNDEDLELFLKEFTKLLNRYHYGIDPYKLRKMPPNAAIGGFTGRGGPEIEPFYFILDEESKKWAIEDGIIEDDDEK